MVLPIGDDNTDRATIPFVNYVLIVANVLVFIIPQGMGENHQFTFAFSTVPKEIVTGEDQATESRQIRHPVTGQVMTHPGLEPTPISVYITLLTSMFMHGGFAHLLGNMLFLWIFGDNVEDALGHLRYLAFYMVCGILASLAHVFTTIAVDGMDGPGALIPSLGASGAISGVLAAYLLFFPKKRVTVIMFRFITDVPAFVAIGIWFAFQLINGLGVLGQGSQKSGVAYAAHIGGFVAGLALAHVFDIGRPSPILRRSAINPWSGR